MAGSVFDCPTCSPNSQKFKLGINLTHLYCTCWTCGPKPLATVLQEALALPPRDAQRLAGILRDDKGILAPEAPLPRASKVTLPYGLGELLPAHRRYLEERRFDPEELVTLWGLKGIGLAARLAWRIFIPVVYHGETVSWTTRALVDSAKPRYISASPEQEKMDAKSILFGFDYVRHSVIITEGPFDVFKIGPGACATLGVKYTTSQVKLLSTIPTRVVCYDQEGPAQRQARKLVNELSSFPGDTHLVTLTSGKDPATSSSRDIKELRRRFLD